jgi:hypothetical protein
MDKATDTGVFFTRARHNKPIRVPLHNRDTGEKTEHWVDIIGPDSDAIRLSVRLRQTEKIEQWRDLVAGGVKQESRRAKEWFAQSEIEDDRARAGAAIVGWSLDDATLPDGAKCGKCEPGNVAKVLEEAPSIQDSVIRALGDRSLFTVSVSASSADTQKPNSASTSPSKEEPKPSENAPPATGSKPETSPRS